MLQGIPSYKWLDPSAFVKALLREDHDVVCIKFFTARIRPYPHDEQAIARQNLYLQALKAQPAIQVIEGYYNRNKTWLPHIVPKCRECDGSRNGMARVMKFDEKRSDVNLTSALLSDAFRDFADSFVLLSGDSDYITPVDIVRFELKKQMLVFNPRIDRPSDLMYHATYYKNIPRDLPGKCQLPDEVTLANGRVVHRPAAWTLCRPGVS